MRSTGALTMNSDIESAICRYTESGGGWTLNVFAANPREFNVPRVLAGSALGSRPEWLQNIVSVATLAERLQQVPKPPPGYILWFEMNAEHELTGFPPLNFLSHP
jgi:hypothetical protein